jgi:hypothetical protein
VRCWLPVAGGLDQAATIIMCHPGSLLDNKVGEAVALFRMSPQFCRGYGVALELDGNGNGNEGFTMGASQTVYACWADVIRIAGEDLLGYPAGPH